MSLASLLTRSVTILTPGTTTDRYHNDVLDWASATEASAKAWVSQASAAEDHDHRDATVTTLAATFAADAPLTPQSRVVVDGQTYEVVGVPNVAYTPRGAHHTECQLRAVTG